MNAYLVMGVQNVKPMPLIILSVLPVARRPSYKRMNLNVSQLQHVKMEPILMKCLGNVKVVMMHVNYVQDLV